MEFVGIGLGKSRQKCFYIPEPHNDFIFAIIGRELGLIGCVFIIMLFVIFIWRGIKVAINAKDIFGTLLARNNFCNRHSGYNKYSGRYWSYASNGGPITLY